MDWSRIKEISGVFLRFTAFANWVRIKPSALFKPRMVSLACSSSARTLIYALQYFRSGVTWTKTTLVIGWILGSLSSERMISLRAFWTSPLIRVFLMLFFLMILLLYYLGTSTMI